MYDNSLQKKKKDSTELLHGLDITGSETFCYIR